MLGFLEKSAIVVMLISGLETYVAIYILRKHTQNTGRSGKAVGWGWGGEGEGDRKPERGKERKEGIKSPTYHRCFCKTI